MPSITKEGKEPLRNSLADPFYAVDRGIFQIVQPSDQDGGCALSLALKRPAFYPLERAVMAIRFNEAFFGTQFPPRSRLRKHIKYLVRDDKKKD